MGILLNVQLFRGGQPQGQFTFDSDTHRNIKVGRLPSAQIKLDDPKASRIHAVIEFVGNDASIMDMGTTEGTTVNGAKITHKVKLNHGDQVFIGDTVLAVGLGAAAVAQAPMPAPVATAPAPAANFAAPVTQVSAPPWSPTPVAAAAPQVQGFVAPQPSPFGAPTQSQPRFDPGPMQQAPIRRITKERLRAAAVESKPHPALPPEDPLSVDNRVLEMRVYWGETLLAMHHYNKPRRITIGESKKTDVFISSEGLPVEEFPLVRYMEDDYVLTFASEMEGEFELSGQVNSLHDLRGTSTVKKDDSLEHSYQLKLPPDSRGIVHWGGATFALRFVPPSRAVPRGGFKNVDLEYLNMLLLSLFLHVSLIVTFILYPHDTESLRDDLFENPDRFASLVLEPPKETQSNKDMLKKIQETVEKKKEQIKEEKIEKPKDAIKLTKNVPVQAPKVRTQEQRAEEVKQQFSKLFTGGGVGGGAGSILGGGGGGSLAGTLSNVIGTAGKGSAGAGMAGLGIRGSGPLTGGGMGTSRGIAGIGTAGRLGGGGMAYGSGVGLGSKTDRGVIGLSTPVVMGALPKEVIQKVINENKNQVRYCYEVELQRNQNLEGKVSLKWIISATGSVAKVIVTDTTLNNATVENCIKSKVMGWKFPAPAGGGIVEVNYPFVLKAS